MLPYTSLTIHHCDRIRKECEGCVFFYKLIFISGSSTLKKKMEQTFVFFVVFSFFKVEGTDLC